MSISNPTDPDLGSNKKKSKIEKSWPIIWTDASQNHHILSPEAVIYQHDGTFECSTSKRSANFLQVTLNTKLLFSCYLARQPENSPICPMPTVCGENEQLFSHSQSVTHFYDLD